MVRSCLKVAVSVHVTSQLAVQLYVRIQLLHSVVLHIDTAFLSLTTPINLIASYAQAAEVWVVEHPIIMFVWSNYYHVTCLLYDIQLIAIISESINRVARHLAAVLRNFTKLRDRSNPNDIRNIYISHLILHPMNSSRIKL